MSASVNDSSAGSETNRLQTLDRGLRALRVIADAPDGISVAELASSLGIARAIAYRIVSTLEDHSAVYRSASGRLHLGAGLLTLSLTFRTLDQASCAVLPIGTHFMWHILNATMLAWMIEVWRRHRIG